MMTLEELYDIVWNIYIGIFSFIPFGSDYVAVVTLLMIMLAVGLLMRNIFTNGD